MEKSWTVGQLDSWTVGQLTVYSQQSAVSSQRYGTLEQLDSWQSVSGQRSAVSGQRYGTLEHWNIGTPLPRFHASTPPRLRTSALAGISCTILETNILKTCSDAT